jgi:hypothetical protein
MEINDIMKLIKFKQNNCTPCKMLDEMLEQNGIKVDEVANLTNPEKDEHLMWAGMHNIDKTPVLLLLDDNGVEIDRHKGVGATGVKRVLAKRGLI